MSDFFVDVLGAEMIAAAGCECFTCDSSCNCDCDSANCECNN